MFCSCMCIKHASATAAWANEQRNTAAKPVELMIYSRLPPHPPHQQSTLTRWILALQGQRALIPEMGMVLGSAGGRGGQGSRTMACWRTLVLNIDCANSRCVCGGGWGWGWGGVFGVFCDSRKETVFTVFTITTTKPLWRHQRYLFCIFFSTFVSVYHPHPSSPQPAAPAFTHK